MKNENKDKKTERNLETALWNDYEDIQSKINSLETKDENFAKLLDERDKIRQVMLKLEINNNDNIVKEKEIIAMNNRELITNKITIYTFIISTSISLYAISRTFNFDQESTITSTLGRNILNGFLPKVFK